MDGKVCNKCGEFKPLSEYNKSSRRKDGHSNRCRECENAYRREWYRKNPEKVRLYCRRDYMRHYEARRASGRRYYAENRERCLEYQRRYREDGGATYRAYKKQYDARRYSKRKASA